jgi:hypothetical protein
MFPDDLASREKKIPVGQALLWSGLNRSQKAVQKWIGSTEPSLLVVSKKSFGVSHSVGMSSLP